MPYIKHIINYSALILIATAFSLFASFTWIENIGFIFAIPSATMLPLFSWVYGACAGSLYAIIFFHQINMAPRHSFLMGLTILFLSMMVLFMVLGSSFLDLVFISAVYLIVTSIAIILKKRKEKIIAADLSIEKNKFYFPISTFKLCVLYFLTLGLFRYYWWYQNWQYIKKRDNKNYSPIFRAIFAVFFYESFLEDINKTNQAHRVRGIKYVSLLASYYILLVIGMIFVTVLNAAYSTLGLHLHFSPASFTSTFNIIIFILGIFLYVAPQLAINRLNHSQENNSFINKKMPIVIFIYCLISLTIWLPASAKLAAAYRTDIRNAFLLYDYGHYQAAYKKVVDHVYEEEGNADAKFLLGQMYLYGKGVTQDVNQAIGWLEEAANLGNVEAQYLVASLYRKGVNENEPDYKKSALWYQKAINGGNTYAINDLATLYASGLGVEKNLDKAFTLYQQAAAKGDGYAMYNLGFHYEKEMTPPNYQLAAEWYEKSIKAKPNACAYHDLGLLYAKGNGVPQNTNKAKSLLKKSGHELLTDYGPEIMNKDAFIKKNNIDDLVSAFAQHQYDQAIKTNDEAALKQKYSAQIISATTIMSKKIADVCWSE